MQQQERASKLLMILVHMVSTMAKGAKSMLNPGSALLTLTYLGSIHSLPNYNVMGLAKASLEANTRFCSRYGSRWNQGKCYISWPN